MERKEEQTNNSIRAINNTQTEWYNYKRRYQLESKTTHKSSGINIEQITILEGLKQHTLVRKGQQTNYSIRELNYTLTEWVNYKRRIQLES